VFTASNLNVDLVLRRADPIQLCLEGNRAERGRGDVEPTAGVIMIMRPPPLRRKCDVAHWKAWQHFTTPQVTVLWRPLQPLPTGSHMITSLTSVVNHIIRFITQLRGRNIHLSPSMMASSWVEQLGITDKVMCSTVAYMQISYYLITFTVTYIPHSVRR
jgi:hypothetical protein